MSEEENRTDDAGEAPDQPQDEAPQADAPQDEPAAEAPQEEPAEAPEEPAEEPAAPAPDTEGADAQAEPEELPEAQKKSDQPPGAELEPIALEPERELSAEERAALEAEQEERAAAEAEDSSPDDVIRREAAVQLAGETRVQATGKRKTSVARVLVTAGSGEFQVNRRTLDEYFPRSFHRTVARQALVASGYEGQVDVQVRVHGGGVSGQADAVRHGIARALCEIDPELRGELKRRGMLTRDARAKERRKAGLKKARKRPQFSKR